MSVLVVPIDASQVAEGDRKQQRVKVAVQMGDKITSQVVEVSAGKGEVKLEVDPKQPLSIAVGPENVSDDEIFHLQTITSRISPNQWAEKPSLTLAPIIVTPAWWILWLRWCRTFVITGRVVCADGSPVPGAEVRAFDVDFFWWWSSVSQVGGSAITDASGHFAIKFRWCCGWWPWWWWTLREWALEPLLVEKISPVLKLNPNLKFRAPDPVPTVDFVNITGGTPIPSTKPIPVAPVSMAGPIKDPTVVTALRDRLVSVLPKVPDLERLRIWPWWPWTPWLDCTPDIIFKVTQNCNGLTKVIVNENIFQTRWDIPTNLNVTLVANNEACCVPRNNQPFGDCSVFTEVCGVHVDNIGGNPGAVTPAGYGSPPIGYVDPGGRDRPFAEAVSLSGLFGTTAQADFYEIEYSPHGASTWNPVPGGALSGFGRSYFDANKTGGQWIHSAGFPVQTFGTKKVYESRAHFEQANPPANWGTIRIWLQDNFDLFAILSTANFFPDGAYDFRVIGYKAVGGVLDPNTRKVMPGCGVQPNSNNLVTIRLDNRFVGSQLPDTVHVSTTEPDCGITAVKIGVDVVGDCMTKQLPNTPIPLEIDFFVTDSDAIGHLDHYTLTAYWGASHFKELTTFPGVVITPLSGQAGPNYANIPAASRPAWKGGTIRLVIPNAHDLFKETCCYLLDLVVYKRNIVSCNGNLVYYNRVHTTFTVIV